MVKIDLGVDNLNSFIKIKDKAYVGTKNGNIWEIDFKTDTPVLKYTLKSEVEELVSGDNGKIYTGTQNSIYGLALDSNEPVELYQWSEEINTVFKSDNGLNYFGSKEGILYQVDVKDKTEKSYNITGYLIEGIVEDANGTLFVASLDGKVYEGKYA